MPRSAFQFLCYAIISSIVIVSVSSFSSAAPLPQLSVTANWTTDLDGNVVILRGTNLMSKDAQTPEQRGFGLEDAKLLSDHGFSVVRLGIFWCNVQPWLLTGGDASYDDVYLASIKRTITLLAKFNIYTLLDFHQDGYSSPWGFGAPAWAVKVGGVNHPARGFPLNMFCIEGATQTDQCEAVDAFWSNERPAFGNLTFREHYIKMVGHVARYMSDQKGNIFGYDPMNEPSLGSLWREALNPAVPQDFSRGTPTFDRILGEFYNELLPSIRSGHAESIVWYETQPLFGLGARTYLPKLPFKNVGLNFHNYASRPPTNLSAPLLNAVSYQANYTVPLLNSEFGGTNNLSLIRYVCALNDEFMVPWTYWAYFNNAKFLLATSGGGIPDDPRQQAVVADMMQPRIVPNLKYDKLMELTRIYPKVVAGTPLQFMYSPEEKTFHLQYSTTMPNGKRSGGLTRVVIPDMLCSRFNTSVVGGDVVSFNRTLANTISIMAHREVSVVTVDVACFSERYAHTSILV